ncbi:MAG: right-handed parallel beta-helix repeat-containing protein [Bacteroidota bacterium]
MFNFFKRFYLILAIALGAASFASAQVMIDGIQYSNLKAAFDAINAGTHQGNINVEIIGNTTETATAVLNASGVGAANYSQVFIYPTATATITSSVQNGIIELQDADFVTIDGRINMAGSTPALTIQSTATSNGVCVRLTKTTAGDGPKNNTIQYVNFVGASATTSTIYGILAGAMGTTLTTGAAGIDNLTIQYNNFRTLYYGIRINGISGGLAQNANISNNNFGNNATVGNGLYYSIYLSYCSAPNVSGNIFNVNTASAQYGIYLSYSSNAVITNNTLENSVTTGSNSYYPMYFTSSTGATVSNNTIKNITSSSYFYGIYFTSSSGNFNVSNNLIENCAGSTFYGIYASSSSGNTFNNIIRSCNTSSTTYGIYYSSSANSNISNNTISNINSTSTCGGIYLSSSGTSNVSQNTISNITGGGDVRGIYSSGSASVNFNSNIIKNITSTSTSTSSQAEGIWIGGTSPNNCILVNNEIAGVFDNSNKTTVSYALAGIRIVAGTGHQIYHNSVNLFGTATATNAAANLSAALFITSTSTNGLNIRNNIFVNSREGYTGSKAYAIYLAGTGNLTSSTINYNDYYVSGSQAVLGFVGNDCVSLNDWQAVVTQDLNSVTLNPLFNSNIKLIPFTGSPVVGLGTPIATVTTDILGNARSATAPTLGAYEQAGDFVPPTITFTPLGNTALLTNRTLSAVITDLSGINAGNLPRIYYRKTTNANTYVDNTNTTDGWKYTIANPGGPDEYIFTIDNSLIYGGVQAGDVIQYFIVAQDASANALVGVSSGTFATSPTSTDLTAANFPVNGVSTSYNLSLAFSGTYQVGAGQTYTTLTGTNGFFAALNSNVVTGNVTVEIVSDINEPGTVTLNQQTEEGGSGFTITIKPVGAPRTLTFNNSGSCIVINQADRITIDGLLNNQNGLTIINTNTATTSNNIEIIGSATNGATDITLKNLNIIGTVGTGSSVYGILLRDASGATTNNSTSHNISILNNNIKKAYHGIRILGNGLNGVQIIGNTIGDIVDSMTVRVRGIILNGCNAPIIKNNEIFNLVWNSSPNIAAIELAAGSISNPVIEGNIIRDVANTSTGGYGAYGINIAANVTNANIANNLISNFYSFGYTNSSTTDNDFAIRLGGTSDGINIYHNTINMAGTIQTNTQTPRNAAVFVTTNTVKNVKIRNNIIINSTQHVAAGAQAVIYWLNFTYHDSLGYYVDYNHYFNGGNKPVFAVLGSSTYSTFDAYKTAVAPLGFDQNSTYGSLNFIAHNNPIVQGTSLLDLTLRKPLFTGMPALDIHGETRTEINNLAGADIANPSAITVQTDLPALTKKGSNATFELTFVPAITAFADGITRSVPAGHYPGFTYQWLLNNNTLTSGVNNITLNNNTLFISQTNPTHAGTYKAIVSYGAVSAQTGNSVLEIETLEPELLSPANNSTDHPIGEVTLTWVPALDATAYILQVSTDPNFNTILVQVDTTGTSYKLTNLQYYTDYYWRVKGYNSQNQSLFTTAWKFTTRPAIYPVALVSPENNAQNLPIQSAFSWNSNVDATEYEIQIASDANFTNIFYTTITTNLSVTVDLQYETNYWWRVRGKNPNYTGLWSETRNFATRPAIFPVVLLTPANNATGMNINVTFTWQNNVDATGYILEIYSDSLITKVGEINTSSISHTYYGLDFNQSYWWRVKAYNAQYQSAWSQVRKFTTAATPLAQITIGTGTSGQSYPLDRYYNMSASEAIYLASEIGMPATITSIAYNKVSGTDVNPIGPVSIFMKHTTDNSLATGTYDTTTFTRVYHGSFPNNATSGWMQVNLSTPFAYNGTNNLAVLVVKHYQDWISAYPNYAYTTVTPNRHRAARDDNNMPTSLTASSSLPNVRFGFSVQPLSTPVLVSPANNAVDVLANVTFTWQTVSDALMYRIQVATDVNFTNIVESKVVSTNSATIQLGYTTTYYWRVRAINAINVSPWSETRSFITAPYVLMGTYYIGDAENAHFPTFTAFFNEINNNAALVGGDVTLIAVSDITEPAQVNIPEFPEYFGTGHSITITTDNVALRTVSANVPDGAVFKLLGADRIEFNGGNHNLKIINTATTNGVAIWLASTNTDAAGAENIEIENTILATGTEDINLYNTAGIFSGAATTIGATPIAPNNNVVIENNKFYNAKRGILFQGHVANRPTGIEIKDNIFGDEEFAGLLYNGFELYSLNAPIVENNTVINPQNIGIVINSANNALVKDNEIFTSKPDLYPGAQYGINLVSSANAVVEHNIIKHFRLYGIFVQSSANAQILKNSITNAGLLNNNIANVSGIFISTGANQGLTVKGNKIFDLNSTLFTAAANGSAYGINISGNAVNSSSTPIIIENNMIWGISGYGSVNPTYVQNNPYAILISNGRYINIYNNTVLMNGMLHSGAGYSGVLFISNSAVQDVDVRNNIFVNKTSASTAQNYIYYVHNAAIFSNLDHNIYQLAGSSNLRIGYTINNSTAHTSLSAWQTATSKDANAKMKVVPFQTSMPFVTYAVLSDPDFISPSLLTTTDIYGVARNSTNNIKGANIPENNDVAARFIVFSNIGTTSLNASWINGNGQGRLVLVSPDELSSNDWYELIATLSNDLSSFASTDGNLSNAVELRYGSKRAYVVKQLTGSARTVSISGLIPSTRYNVFVVEYYTNAGVRYNPFAGVMNPRFVETAFDVTPPTVAPATNVSFDMFTANWNYNVSQPIDGFELWLNNDIVDVGNAASNGSYFADLFAIANTQYQYKVRAKRGLAVSEWSAIQNVNTYPVNPISGPNAVCIGSSNTYTISLGNVSVANINWTSNLNAQFLANANGVNAIWNEIGNATLVANITDTYGNTGAAYYAVLVNSLPIVTAPADFEICALGTPQTLTGGLPVGGTYSGPGVSNGVFNPSVAGVGAHTITYTYTDANGCTNSAEFTITVINSIVVTAPNNIEVCIDADPITLSGATPVGGVYTLNGNPITTFNPATAGAGVHTITYTYTDQYNCTNSAQFTITVNPLPQISVPQDISVCVDAPSFTLTGATPTGGTYTINGNAVTQFNPSVAGVGEHTVTYTYTDENGCTNSDEFTITVNPLPTINVPNNLTKCVVDAPFALTGATPAGGTYSGNGVANNIFDPAAAGAGTHTITYTYTDNNGCVNSGTFEITVIPLPVITTQPSDVYAQEFSNVTLTVSAVNPTNTIQWQVKPYGSNDWTDIPGATSNTLSLNYILNSMNGNQYRALVTSCATIASNVATLYVVTLPNQATQINWINWGRTQITFNWTNGNGNGRIVVATKQGSWPVNAFVPQNNVYYDADPLFGNVSTKHTVDGNDYYVVYNGTGNGPVTVTGLERLQNYTFHVFEYNQNGGTIIYNTSSELLANNPRTRQTSRKDADEIEVATSLQISSVTPNPANDRISFVLDVENAGLYCVELVNVIGETVYVNNVNLNTGAHNFMIELSNATGQLPSGNYFLRVSGNGETAVHNVVIVK